MRFFRPGQMHGSPPLVEDIKRMVHQVLSENDVSAFVNVVCSTERLSEEHFLGTKISCLETYDALKGVIPTLEMAAIKNSITEWAEIQKLFRINRMAIKVRRTWDFFFSSFLFHFPHSF